MLNIYARAMMTASRCEPLEEKDDQVTRDRVFFSNRPASSDPRCKRRYDMMAKLATILCLQCGSE
ncbi:hypothetical protein SAMN05444358_11313 [Ruegeria halocynthiae]|uniref:Uncharacterized protein n=1 Tax=Ruegeria halocynthiae TaxID=985054 RepID=A0A1H3F3S5_9RHOB|nr:hypothetical protein SAMN05444358_11313 [Ruegeria halocynthiae]